MYEGKNNFLKLPAQTVFLQDIPEKVIVNSNLMY